MFRKFKYKLRQALYNVRKSIATIFTIAVAVSLIAGLFYYFDGFERAALRYSSRIEEFDTLSDFNLVHNSANQKLNCSVSFDLTDSGVESSISRVDLDVKDIYKYQTIASKKIKIKNSQDNFKFYTILFNQPFYDSERFGQYYYLYEGRTPENYNEIIIDYIIAVKLGWEVGMTINLTTYYQYNSTLSYEMGIPNITVVGAYIPRTNSDYSIVNGSSHGFENFYAMLPYEEVPNMSPTALQLHLEQWSIEDDNIPVLSYSDFTNDTHPFQVFVNDVNEELPGMGLLYTVSGYGVNLNREFPSFFRMRSPDVMIGEQLEILNTIIPREIVIYDHITEPLQEIFLIANILSMIFQIINIPLLVISIIIASSTLKSTNQNRMDYFLLLRSKGVSKKLIRGQIFTESLVNGVVASILGSVLGFLSFYGHALWIDPIMYSGFNMSEHTLFADLKSILISIALGIILSVISGFSSMKYVLKLDTSELLNVLGKEDMDVEYDEQTVFISRSVMRTKFKEEKDILEEKEKKIRKSSIIFISIGSLPILLYVFYYLASSFEYLSSIPRIAQFVDLSKSGYFQFTILLIISPIFLGIGITRLFCKESPRFFAKFSRFIGRAFVGRRSYMLGLQMLKNKRQYCKIIILLGVCVALFVHSNVITYTHLRTENMYDNYGVGTDFKKSMNYDVDCLINQGNVTELESLVKNVKTPENESLVEDVTIYYTSRHVNFSYLYQHYMNLSSYYSIMLNSETPMPDRQFLDKILHVMEFNTHDPYGDGIPGVIVNEKFLERTAREVNDTFYVDYKYYDSRFPTNSSLIEFDGRLPFQIRILEVADYFPGIYVRSVSEYYYTRHFHHLVIDFSCIPFHNDEFLLHAPQMKALVNVNMDLINYNRTALETIMNEGTQANDAFFSSDYQHFNHDWKSLEEPDPFDSQTWYKIIYFTTMVVLIQVSLGLPMFLTSIRKKDQTTYGIMLSRGMGKLGVLKFISGEITVVFLISIMGGLFAGLLSSFLVLLVGRKINKYTFGLGFRYYANPLDLTVVLSILVVFSIVVFLLGYLIDSRKSISEYLIKF